ncbi:MAG: Holliday junction branch migration protein RuvA [Planctomycetes bacterium]|nr:Holliday junction branch migration protein RuvA [Planctomycetota bacterium]
MYDFLEGQVARRTPTQLVLDVGGVGYALNVPVGSGFAEGGRARAWVHFVVREDAHSLYGFDSLARRELFRLLLSVRGVGPGVALALLSGLEVDALVQAVVSQDAAALTRVRGVGKKTAEQMLLDLRDKIGRFGAEATGAAAAPSSGDDVLVADAVGALTSIGYKDKEAEKLVRKLLADEPDLDLEQIVRAALRG